MEEKSNLLRLLNMVFTAEAQELESVGVEPTADNLMLLLQAKKAAKGDTAAFRCLVNLLAEDHAPPAAPASWSHLTDGELLAALEAMDDGS